MASKKNIVIVLDKSGSMEHRRDATINNYNEYISSIAGVDAKVTLYTFSSRVQKIEEASKLSRETYVPSGNTALFDALAQAIYAVPNGETALVIVLSDGEENWSRFQKGDGLAALIADRKTAGFEFIFMGCDESCIKDAKTLVVPYFTNLNSSWTPPQDGWVPGRFRKGYEVYCATQNYCAGLPATQDTEKK